MIIKKFIFYANLKLYILILYFIFIKYFYNKKIIILILKN